LTKLIYSGISCHWKSSAAIKVDKKVGIVQKLKLKFPIIILGSEPAPVRGSSCSIQIGSGN